MGLTTRVRRLSLTSSLLELTLEMLETEFFRELPLLAPPKTLESGDLLRRGTVFWSLMDSVVVGVVNGNGLCALLLWLETPRLKKIKKRKNQEILKNE